MDRLEPVALVAAAVLIGVLWYSLAGWALLRVRADFAAAAQLAAHAGKTSMVEAHHR
jgi:ABC-type branched-subunit amino acid transport system permease subunit